MYADSLSVLEARDQYFAENGFTAAGYTDKWVKLKLGPLPLAFPNSPARQAAVPLHDLHHVATGYATTWTGEAEIGAWEIGAGCGRYWAAWGLNLSAFAVGLWIAPLRLVRAFRRGRRSKSLYSRAMGDDLLALRVGELRAKLELPPAGTAPPITAGDAASFAAWKLASLVLMAASLAPLAALIWFVAR
jgi:hypothetical protein